MTYPIKQSTTAQALVFYMVASSDHIAAGTGLTCTVTIRKSGGSFASPGGSVTEIANGWYQVAGNATDTNTLGPLLLHATATGADPTDVCYHVVAYDPQDAVRAGLTALPNAAAEAAGGLYTRGAGAGQINQANNGNIDANAVRLGGTTQTGRDVGASVLLSAGTGTGQLDFTSGVVKANLAQILGTALTETAGQIAAGFKQFFNIASPTSTMNLVTTVGSVTGSVASVTGAVGSVTGAVGSVTGNVGGNVVGSVASVSGAVGSVTGNVGGNVTGSIGSVATNGITAASIATNAIDADALAPDAVTEIAAGVSAGSAPTASDNATAVWNAVASSFNTAGSMGQKLNAAGGAADPLTNAVPGSYAAGTAGYALGTLPWGAGPILWTYTLTRSDNANPIQGATIYVTSDAAGNTPLYGPLTTDAAGQVKFLVSSAGTYYVWRQLVGYQFTNPDREVVS
jgi:uncharacterized protein YjbJ (UPF0337 family)